MIKKTMLAAAVAAFAFAALPAFAAADPHLDLPTNKNFTVHGGEAILESGATINCETTTGEGEFENGTTGWVIFTFETCKGPFGIHCGNEATGQIVTTTLPFHLKTTKGDPVVLFTPNPNGSFAHFSCSAFFNITVDGTGVIGTITAPGYNEESSTATIDISGEGGEQVHTTVDGDETEYVLTSTLNGGEAESAVEVAEGTLTFEEGKGELTEE